MGITFYQMCTAKLPFYANSTENGGDLICSETEPELPNDFENYRKLYHK